MASQPNIYPRAQETFPGSLFGRPARVSYRKAVKQIVLDVKARHCLSSDDLAERIGVSKDTIDNAESETSSLEAVSLLNIAYFYGEPSIDPVRQLYLCAPSESLSPAERIARANREIAAALSEMERVI